MIARRVWERWEMGGEGGEVIGEEESPRVLGWMDEARRMAGIMCGEELDGV